MNDFWESFKFFSIKLLKQDKISKGILSVFLIYLLFINIKTYILFIKDKKYSLQEDCLRISEATLFKHCFFGGALGGFLGMKIAHHKTQKLLFSVFVPLLIIIQILITSFIIGFFGFWIYML